jgi:DNA repair exonuclease SbcCD ATPase subunit
MIERLTVHNFRGIRGEFEIEPDGETVVLVGPNGSGKSSIIASLDFLLTGRIQSLSGEGTRHITEKRHGRHVDAEPSDAWVEAEFNTESGSVIARRELDNRDELQTDVGDGEVPKEFDAMRSAAERGLHLLSRDQILDFITSKSQTRSNQLRKFLNLYNVRDRRLALDNAAQHFEEQVKRHRRECSSKAKGLYGLFGIEDHDEETLLDEVNELRSKLGGEEIDDIQESKFHGDLESPLEQARYSPLLTSERRGLIRRLNDWFEDGVDEFARADAAYREKLTEISGDEEAVRALDRLQLIQKGYDALEPDAEQCPLCLKRWDPEELERRLERRLERARNLKEQKNDLLPLRDDAQQQLTDVRVVAESLYDVLRSSERFDPAPVNEFIELVADWEDAYDGDLLDEPPFDETTQDERISMLKPLDLEELVSDLMDHVEERPEIDDLQGDWEDLKAGQEKHAELVVTRGAAKEYREIAEDMRTVHRKYIEAKDEVLIRIYSEIEDQFGAYYTSLHPDESDMTMDLSPTETGLDLEVDFYDRGRHPPHALHSEGHQDSMGLCLYFSLCDWLRDLTDLPILMLDDVVMSVDSDHRRPLAETLATELSEKYQLFITTHDDTWHRHLRSAGVVSSSNSIQFIDWNVRDGPITPDYPELEWDTIAGLLEDGNKSAAAHQTRRMAEWFLREASHRLEAKVPFKSDGRWTLGDFKNGVVSRYRELIGEAKAAEDSWNRDLEALEKLERRSQEIFECVDEDGAALNPNVHYNEDDTAWANCNRDELRSAIVAYRDLYRLLWCDVCDSCMSLMEDGNESVGVRCNCGEIDFNLRGK